MFAAENELKGQGFKSFASAVQSLFGEEALQAWVDALPDSVRSTWIHGGIVAGGWYPISWYRDFHEALHRARPWEPELSRRISMEATKNDLQGVYRFVLQYMSPHTIMGQAPRIFGLYNRGGSVSVLENMDDLVVLAYDDCHGADRNIWEDVIGATVATVESCRVRVLSAAILDGGETLPWMVCRIRWEVPWRVNLD